MKRTFLAISLLGASLIGCDGSAHDQHASAPADAPGQGYDPRAAPGSQPPAARPPDDARPAAAQVAGATGGADGAPQGTVTLAETDRAFVLDAVRQNDLELKLADIAKDRASTERVKQFAKSIADDHQAMNQQLKALATRLNVDLHRKGSAAAEEQAVVEMKRRKGADFDSAYVQHEVHSHEQALETYRSAAQNVKNPEVLDVINKALPQLESHHAAVKELATVPVK